MTYTAYVRYLGGVSDTRAATWQRHWAKMMRNGAELEREGCRIEYPENFEKHPSMRQAHTSASMETSRTGVGSSKGPAPDRPE